MMISKLTIKKILYTLIVFFVIFNPPLLKGFSFTTFFCIIGFLTMVFHYRQMIYILRNRYINEFLSTFYIFIFYSTITFLMNALINHSKSDIILRNLASLIITNFSLVLVSLFIIYHFIINDFDIDFVEQLYINAGTMQAVAATASFIFPSVKTYFNGLMIVNSGSEKISRTLQYTSSYRNFGLASTLYDIFGFSMSLLALLAFIKCVRGEKKQFFAFVIITFAAIINARTSIIIIGVGVIIIFIKEREIGLTANQLAKMITSTAAGVLVLTILYNALSRGPSEHTRWLFTGITEITTFLSGGGNIGYFNTLFEDFLFFPEGIKDLIVGTGMTPAQAIYVNSDVGYIQNIWVYGIIGSMIIYYMYLTLFRRLSKSFMGQINCSLGSVFTILIAIYLIKLNPLGYSQASVIFLPLSLFLLYRFDRLTLTTSDRAVFRWG